MIKTRDQILVFLADCRREAGIPEIGCREVEIVSGDKRVWRTLRSLKAEGLIVRRNGWVWLTEAAFERR